MWVSFKEEIVDSIEYINDVYNRIIELEKSGDSVILRYDELSNTDKTKVIDKMKDFILMKNLLNQDSELSRFVDSHHFDAWKKALESI